MSREHRMRYAGIIFYLVIVTLIVSSSDWLAEIESQIEQITGDPKTDFSIFLGIVGIGTAFLTSELIGYIFNTLVLAVWNLQGGYGNFWGKMSILDRKRTTKKAIESKNKERLKDYNLDVLFSYDWQQGSKPLIEWVSRRYNIMFMNWTVITGIVAAFSILLVVNGGQKIDEGYNQLPYLLIPYLCIVLWLNRTNTFKRMRWTLIISIGLIILLWILTSRKWINLELYQTIIISFWALVLNFALVNAKMAQTDASQMIDVWFQLNFEQEDTQVPTETKSEEKQGME